MWLHCYLFAISSIQQSKSLDSFLLLWMMHLEWSFTWILDMFELDPSLFFHLPWHDMPQCVMAWWLCICILISQSFRDYSSVDWRIRIWILLSYCHLRKELSQEWIHTNTKLACFHLSTKATRRKNQACHWNNDVPSSLPNSIVPFFSLFATN